MTADAPTSLIAATLAAIRPADEAAAAAARERQGRLTKPPGSMGRLEELSVRLCAIAGTCPAPVPESAAVAIFAADHGVHAQGVSPWPQAVTAQMVGNFLAGGAVVNALAREANAQVVVVDMGIATELPAADGLLRRAVRPGTADMTTSPAMSAEEVSRAVEIGIEVAHELIDGGAQILVTGDMGIANTTASAALVSVLTETAPAEVTGRGTGIDDATLSLKVEVITRALERHRPTSTDPWHALAAVGGLEHAGLVGFLLGAAERRIPVVLDGVIACSAALVACAIVPSVTDYLVAGHRSAEPGATRALDHLGLNPLLALELRLGEGSGGTLALGLVRSAARLLTDVATFDSAGVTEHQV